MAQALEAAREHPDGELARRLAATTEPTIDDVAAALAAGEEDARRIAAAAGRWLGRTVAALIGTLDVRHVVLLGSVTHLGDPWLEAVRDEAARRALGLLARETRIEVGGAAEDTVLLGASALLMIRELGLVPAR